MNALLAEIIYPLLGTIGAALIALVASWLRKQGLDARVIGAAERAAGVGYARMLASGLPLTDPTIWRIGVDAATEYLFDRIPDTLKANKVDETGARGIAHAQIGRLLALDPTVAIGNTAQPGGSR